MKVTIEVTDAVLEEARDYALREGTTVDALAEDGMRRILEGKHETLRPESQDAPIEAAPQAAQVTPARRSFLDSLDHIGAAFGDLEA